MAEDKKPKSFLEDMASQKPESFQEEVFIKQKKNYVPTIVTSVIVLFVFGILYFTLTKGVAVPDMAKWNEGEIYNWANSNKLTVVNAGTYNEDIEKGVLLSQSPAAGKTIRKNGTLTVDISKGPDPTKKIDFPDLKSMTKEEINAWIETNKLTGVNIKEEFNAVFDEGSVINFDFTDGDENNFLRKNRIKIYISKGPEKLTDTVTVPDFSGKTKLEVAKWCNTNEIDITYTEDFNEYYEEGKIYSQSISAKTKMKRSDSLEVGISLGKAVIMPNFVGMTQSKANEMAEIKKIKLYSQTEISSRTPGTVLSQDITAGSTISHSTLITLTVAVESDSITVPDFSGMTQSEASSLASIHNVKTFFRNVESTKELNEVVSQSVAPGTVIDKETLVTISISEGNIEVPEFVGKSKEDADTIAEELGLNLVYKEIPSTDKEDETIIAQNKVAGDIIKNSTKITLSIAKNNGIVVPNLTSLTKEEIDLWSSKNKTTVTIIEKYSDSVPIGNFFNQNYIDTFVPKDEPVVIYKSLGWIPVKNFIGQSKLDVIEWEKEVNSRGGNITVSLLDDEESSNPVGTVVTQSISKDIVPIGSNVNFWIATNNLNNSIPDFTGLREDDVKKYCDSHSITYKIVDRYSETLKGTIFGQNYVGETLPSGTTLQIYRSKGYLYIPSFKGRSKIALDGWVNEVNLDGANVKINYTLDETSDKLENTVLTQSIYQKYKASDITIDVTIAPPKFVDIPNVEGLDVNEAIERLEENHVTYKIYRSYVYGQHITEYPKNTVYSQSHKGSANFGFEVTISVSDGAAPKDMN